MTERQTLINSIEFDDELETESVHYLDIPEEVEVPRMSLFPEEREILDHINRGILPWESVEVEIKELLLRSYS